MSTSESPPQSHSLMSSVTSTHRPDYITNRYSPEDGQDILLRLAGKMGPFFVGPLPARGFLNTFLHPSPTPPPFEEGMFNPLIELCSGSEHETKWYDEFMQIISPHVPNLTLVNTFNAEDPAAEFPYGLKPNCLAYAKPKGGGKDVEGLGCSHVDFIIEIKSESDPFVDKSFNSRQFDTNSEVLNPFVCPSGSARQSLGQLTAYASAVLGTQYRTHMFMVFVVKNYARLIRWDRSGALVTERIYFNKQSFLLDFFIRYDIASREARGHDTTVSLPSQDEIELAKAIVPELKQERPLLAVQHSGCRYIICSPEPQPSIPVGCWTRSSIAFDTKNRRRVLLKDSWRLLLKDLIPEGDIYCRLHDARVPNIPSLLSAGDVGNDQHHQSQTDQAIHNLIPNHSSWALTPHRHYRIVLGIIGRKLEKFKHTREVVAAMYAALNAHKAAYDNGILHQDVTPGNILIVGPDELKNSPDTETSNIEGGMLTDWDLSETVDPNDKHCSRTGTWKFMAADLVERPNIPQTFVHDLESFFWVLLWIVLTRVQTSWTEGTRLFIHGVMNPKVYKNGSGGRQKTIFLTAKYELSEKNFQIPGEPTLRDFLEGLYLLVATRYDDPPVKRRNTFAKPMTQEEFDEAVETYERRLGDLKDHSAMINQFRMALDIMASPQRLVPPDSEVQASNSGSKRSREMVEDTYNQTLSSKRRR